MLHRLIIPATFILLWSSAFIATKYGVLYAPPLAILAVRMVLVVVLLGSWLIWREGVGIFTTLAMRSVCGQLLVGVLIHLCYLGGVFLAIDHGMGVGLAALIVGLQPILTAWLAAWLFKEPLTAVAVVGLLLGLIGLYIVVDSRFDVAQAGFSGAGLVAIIVALLGISSATLLQKQIGQNGMMLLNAWFQYLAAAVGFLCISLATETWVFDWQLPLFGALAWMVFAISLGAMPLLMLMIQAGEATRVASLFYLVTPVTALLAWLFFDERLALNSWLGMGLVVIGVALVVAPKEQWRTLSSLFSSKFKKGC